MLHNFPYTIQGYPHGWNQGRLLFIILEGKVSQDTLTESPTDEVHFHGIRRIYLIQRVI